MVVCNDKVCEAILCGDCESLIPSMCGNRVPNFVEGSCFIIRFEGVDDLSINQGECIDLKEGVHAYDGNGNEIDFTVAPSEIGCCDTGEFEVIYTASGAGDKMLPSICGSSALYVPECGMTTANVRRTITVKPYSAVCESKACCASVVC